jgi:hypothetical protein
MEQLKVHSQGLREFYFWAGIVATFAYRIIIILTGYPSWLKFTWYVGTIGFVLYFVHRYQISERRSKLIHEHALAHKVAGLSELSKDDKAAMSYVFQSLESSKEKWNYIFIFVMSGLALVWGMVTDFVSWLR